MGEEGKMQRDSKSVSGVKGESITLKWPPLDDGFQYFIVKHGKEIIGNMFGSTLAKLIKDKRFTVSWSKSILAVKIANLTDEDKGRYTLLVYADGKSVKKESVVLLDVAGKLLISIPKSIYEECRFTVRSTLTSATTRA